MPRARRNEITMTPEAVRVLRQFRVVFNSVRKHFRVTEKKAGISGAHVWALSVVKEHPHIGVGDLARAMDVHQSTASNLVRTLLAEELVAAEKDPADRRAVQLTITAKGNRVLRSAPNPYEGVLPEALHALKAGTLKRLERDLEELIAVLDPDHSGAHIPLGRADK
ncbi:MAG TPA: MarR family winged helix-turn-helix transcriptional regulator [Ramlibacter sp.]|nr:MarR family winged helix-turn-helix transcriptional regulator [Ramlibacter sp.]